MMAKFSSETSVDFQQTTRRYIPENTRMSLFSPKQRRSLIPPPPPDPIQDFIQFHINAVQQLLSLIILSCLEL
jgi:hypothetical protein